MNGIADTAEVDLEKLIREAEHLVERRNAEALPLTERAMYLAEQSKNPRHIAHAKYILAFYYSLVANDYERAIQLCNAGLSNLIYEQDLNEIGYKIYMTLGNSYQLSGEVFSAQESYMKGLKHLEARNALNNRELGFLASFYYNISLLLSSAELDISSEDYLDKAIDIYRKMGDGFKLSKCYVAQAGIYENKKEYSKAIEILYKALELDEKMEDPYSIALTKANLGILHLRTASYDSSFRYLIDALEYFESNKMAYEAAMVKVNLGETFFSIGQKKEGISHLLETEDLFNKRDNKRELSRVYELLASFIAETGDYKSAINYQRKYTESLKYFFNIEKTNALTRAKKEFESDLKEKEARLLKEKNEEIKTYAHKLEVSNNELQQFAHVTSHDLREPLRMVNSYMTLLKKSMNGQLTEQQNEFIGFAIDGAKRMERLIVDLLRLAKVDANPQIGHIKLQSVVDEIKLNLEALLQEKGAQILSSGLPEIMADRTQMLQLFQNIIGNGIKYNKSAPPVVVIKCFKKKDEIEITIADNGIGIPEQYREKVFQIFQRLHATEYSGSGIGLAICKKIVDSMNGKISIADSPTGGTMFKIVLPKSVVL